MEKLVIIGAGIAGLTAAIYAARANLSPLVVSGKEEGGQLMLTTVVENYPCFPEGIMGPDMISKAKEQAKRFGTRFKDGNVEQFSIKNSSNKGTTAPLSTLGNGEKYNTYEIVVDGEKIEAKSVIIATGASARMLGLESEKKYFAKGVHTCATCDGYFYSGKDIVVVGGGDSACEESLFLAKLVNSVTIIHRRDAFRASKIMQERVFSNSKVKVVWNSSVEEILGDGKKVTAVKIKNVGGSISELKTDAVFLAIGHIPNSAAFKGILGLDENGYIKADSRMRTKLPGVFAAGDVYDRLYKQAVTAASMGCQAALEAERYLEGISRQ